MPRSAARILLVLTAVRIERLHTISEDDAVASGRAVVRAELGWQNESEAREETLAQLSPVIAMTFNCVCSTDAQQSASEVVKALAEFESWYEARFERAFWVLLEQQVEDLPLVER